MPEKYAKKSHYLKAINTYFIYLNQSCFLNNLNKKQAIIKNPATGLDKYPPIGL
jgi:hypothetical protein